MREVEKKILKSLEEDDIKILRRANLKTLEDFMICRKYFYREDNK